MADNHKPNETKPNETKPGFQQGSAKPGDEVTLGLRPEHILFGEGPNRMELKADLSESLGGSTLIYGQTANGDTKNLQTAGRHALAKGTPFTVSFSTDDAYLFDKTGQAF